MRRAHNPLSLRYRGTSRKEEDTSGSQHVRNRPATLPARASLFMQTKGQNRKDAREAVYIQHHAITRLYGTCLPRLAGDPLRREHQPVNVCATHQPAHNRHEKGKRRFVWAVRDEENTTKRALLFHLSEGIETVCSLLKRGSCGSHGG